MADTINLGLYSDRAFEILDSLHEAVKPIYVDGFTKCSLERAIDGEVVLEKKNAGWYKCVRSLAKEKLGLIFKKYLYECCRDFARRPGGYDKNSDEKIKFKASGHWHDYSTIKFEAREFFCIYDLVCGHSIQLLKRTYSDELVNSLVGQPRNPFVVEQEKMRLDEVAKLEAECEEVKKTVDKKYDAQINELYKQINALRAARTEEFTKIGDEYKAKIADLNNLFEMQKTMMAQAE